MTYPITQEDTATFDRTVALYKQTGEKPHKGGHYSFKAETSATGETEYVFDAVQNTAH